MTSLRMRVVEAGARAIFYSGERTKNLVWDSINDDQRRYYLQLSRDALDGHLDCLAENADEWWFDAFEPENRQDRVTDGLLAVLRKDR